MSAINGAQELASRNALFVGSFRTKPPSPPSVGSAIADFSPGHAAVSARTDKRGDCAVEMADVPRGGQGNLRGAIV